MGADASKDAKAVHHLTPEQRSLGLERLRLGFLVLFAFPGSPTVYYGDEVGMEGWEDPFNRRTYIWGWEDTDLRDYVAALGSLRHTQPALRRGEISYMAARGGLLAFTRSEGGRTLLIAANNSSAPASFPLPAASLTLLLGQAGFQPGRDGAPACVTLPPMGGFIAEL